MQESARKVQLAPDVAPRLRRLYCTEDEIRAFNCFAHSVDGMNEIEITPKFIAETLDVSGMTARKILERLQRANVLMPTQKRNVYVVTPHLVWGGELKAWPKARSAAQPMIALAEAQNAEA